MTDTCVKTMTKDERDRADRVCIYSSDFACTTIALKKMMFLLDNYNFDDFVGCDNLDRFSDLFDYLAGASNATVKQQEQIRSAYATIASKCLTGKFDSDEFLLGLIRDCLKNNRNDLVEAMVSDGSFITALKQSAVFSALWRLKVLC